MAVSPLPSSLIERARNGDVHAFELLIEPELSRVRRFARSMCADDALADDIAQEALLKAYLGVRAYSFQSAFSTWLFTIVRNTFIDSCRRSQGSGRANHDALDTERLADTEDMQPDTAVMRHELRTQIRRALAQLPVEYRTTVVLFDVEGLSQEEVAAIEGTALGTVKSRLSRGRRQLRALLVEAGVMDPGNEGAAMLVEPRRRIP